MPCLSKSTQLAYGHSEGPLCLIIASQFALDTHAQFFLQTARDIAPSGGTSAGSPCVTHLPSTHLYGCIKHSCLQPSADLYVPGGDGPDGDGLV